MRRVLDRSDAYIAIIAKSSELVSFDNHPHYATIRTNDLPKSPFGSSCIAVAQRGVLGRFALSCPTVAAWQSQLPDLPHSRSSVARRTALACGCVYSSTRCVSQAPRSGAVSAAPQMSRPISACTSLTSSAVTPSHPNRWKSSVMTFTTSSFVPDNASSGVICTTRAQLGDPNA